MGISKNSIDDLRKKAKISDFILSTTSGKLRGSKGMAVCPFHGEKTASMSFTDIENLYHCFGCKQGGDIFHFVQEINNLEFQEAVEFIAEKYLFKLIYTKSSNKDEFKHLQDKMNLISEYFSELIFEPNSIEAKNYLLSRMYTDSDIGTFNIGFIDKDNDRLLKFFKKNNISEEDLKKLGFISSNNNFLFKNRIMFPILNLRNEIIAFGGRSLDSFGAKYLNSSDSNLYKKNKNFYFTKNFLSSVRKKGYVILVEGYFDVLALNKMGYQNVASPSGTALTLQQLGILNRYTNKILLCFDNDEAGLLAAERVLEIKNQVSNKLEINCLNLPLKYKDLADLYESQSENINKILKNNQEIIEYLIDKFIFKNKDKKTTFAYFRKLTAKLSPLEVDIALDFLSKKLKTNKDILKEELNFKSYEKKNDYISNKTSNYSVFKDIIISEIIKNNFNLSKEIEEILSLDSQFESLIDNLKTNKLESEKYINISYSREQFNESVTRLFLVFSEIKINLLIKEFEESNPKNFALLQEVEDLKKKKEIYQNTL